MYHKINSQYFDKKIVIHIPKCDENTWLKSVIFEFLAVTNKNGSYFIKNK